MECEAESDEFGDHDDFDDDEGMQLQLGQSHGHGGNQVMGLSIPHPVSPIPELQFPQHLSGTPSVVIRNHFMNYGGDPTKWPVESLQAFPNYSESHIHSVANPDVASFGGNMGSGSLVKAKNQPHSLVHQTRGNHDMNNFTSAASAGSTTSTPSSTTSSPINSFRPEKKDKVKRAATNQGGEDRERDGGSGVDNEPGQTVKVLVQSNTPGEPPKKVKMHQCRICQKLFPRPSGLATHMNSHSGARRKCFTAYSYFIFPSQRKSERRTINLTPFYHIRRKRFSFIFINVSNSVPSTMCNNY